MIRMMNLVRLVIIGFIAFFWVSLFGLILPLFWVVLDFVTGKDASKLVHDFWVAWAVLTITFFCLDIFFVWAIRKQKGRTSFPLYPLDYPIWKKMIHFGTIGKYSKTLKMPIER